FLWISFMLAGFGLTLCGIFFKKALLDWFWFRTIHLAGIIYVGILSVQGRLCPLTIWENALRPKVEAEATYSGSFIIHYLEKLVYPEIDPAWLQLGTLGLGVFTFLAYVIAPPLKIKGLIREKKS
ncbi:MAG: hypothetical protein A2142_07005, partial [candidate division Zixibacteria bacterium RBG_16_48_11]